MKKMIAALVASVASLGVQAQPITGEVTGGVTVTGQYASDSRIKQELAASFDLFVEGKLGRGDWFIYIEGNTSPVTNGVAETIREANANAGTAIGPDKEGNVQVSELKYRWTLEGGGYFTAGMMDPSGYMDHAPTANDENRQFLGITFVNNPIIEFPDYSLGVAYEQHFGATGPEVFFVLTSSHGLADNPNATYAQAFNVDNPKKGAFVGFGARGETGSWHGELGAWAHTAPHDSLDGTRTDERNYGVYGLVGRTLERSGFDLRLGWTNPDVFQGKAFAGLTWEYRARRLTFGAGASHIWVSSKLPEPNKGDLTQLELYARMDIGHGVEITPDIQYVVNSSFDRSGSVYDKAVTIYGIRAAFAF